MTAAVKWCTDFEKQCIVLTFTQRGWQRIEPDERETDWHIYWASVQSTHRIFSAENGIRLNDHQLLNHFPNHYELTRKDYMVKNIKRYRKDCERDGLAIGERDPRSGRYLHLELMPDTYMLPQDYSIFLEDFRHNPHITWIMKPAGSAQGKGIFLINKMAQVRKWARENKDSGKNFVVSRYLDRPLLIGGKKFDLRLYVLVTSFRPLRAYISRHGFARFCTVKYNPNLDSMDNMFVHLTNVSLQKFSAAYNDIHGGKWNLENLRLLLESTRGKAATDKLFTDIHWIILQSLKSVRNVMVSDRHCFELYGYDVIIDDDLKPWLIEVNASPSLSATTVADRIMKNLVINDVYSIVCPSAEVPDVKATRSPTVEQMGSFQVLYDETLVALPAKDEKKVKPTRSGTWK